MGLSFKKIGRGLKKIAKKNRGGFTRLVKKVGPGLVLGAVTGGVGAGIIAKAASAAKTLGKKVKGLETPKSLVPVIRAAQIHVKKTRQRLPGGAPMPPMIATPSVGIMASSERPKAKRYLYRSANPRTARGRAKMRTGDVTAGETFKRPRTKKAKRKITAPPSAKQIAQRERFKAMVAARRKSAA